MFREAEEPSRNMHPSFRPKPLSTMQLLSQSSKLDDSATHDKITNVDVFHAQQPPTVPCTYDTVYDPSHPDADWSGMVSLKNHHKKHTQNHASQRLGITQCEHGIVAKEERQEWDHRKQPEGSYKNSTTFVIGGINNDEDRFKTEYRRLAHHEATSRDQLTLDKRQKAVRRIPDPAQARTLRDRHQQAQAQYDSAGSILSQSQQQSPRYGYGNGYGDGYGDGETPRSHHQQHQQQQQQQEENSPYCNGQSSQLTRTGSNNNHNMSMSMASGGGGGNNTNYNNTGCNSSSIGNGASYARKSFISDLAGQISAKVEAPKKVVANDSAFSHNRLLVTDNFQPFPGTIHVLFFSCNFYFVDLVRRAILCTVSLACAFLFFFNLT